MVIIVIVIIYFVGKSILKKKGNVAESSKSRPVYYDDGYDDDGYRF